MDYLVRVQVGHPRRRPVDDNQLRGAVPAWNGNAPSLPVDELRKRPVRRDLADDDRHRLLPEVSRAVANEAQKRRVLQLRYCVHFPREEDELLPGQHAHLHRRHFGRVNVLRRLVSHLVDVESGTLADEALQLKLTQVQERLLQLLVAVEYLLDAVSLLNFLQVERDLARRLPLLALLLLLGALEVVAVADALDVLDELVLVDVARCEARIRFEHVNYL